MNDSCMLALVYTQLLSTSYQLRISHHILGMTNGPPGLPVNKIIIITIYCE